MKHVVTYFDFPNEMVIFNYSLSIASFFRNFSAKISPFTNCDQQYKILIVNKLLPTGKNLPDVNSNPKGELWSLYFDGSKWKEGIVVGCFILDPRCKKDFTV